ncbi:hypothetical protein GCM10023187_24370 [Nibrella viscosa]|uniref:Lipid A 3-O-deacylase (PagL) n=1 Tax=Nibrella viscosa TaxID=1084524 RepID=A0ABP8KG18_9BACT
MKVILCLLITGYLPMAAVQAQPDSAARSEQISARLHYGFIIPHSESVRAVSNTNPAGVELTYSRMALSRRAWENCNCFARIGAYLNYTSFANPSILGETFGAGAYFEPLLSYRRRTTFSLRATAGLAYLTRVYDEQTNPQNMFFSMPLSGLLALSLNGYYQLAGQLQLVTSINYNHISNGGTRQPNKGMNFPTASVGLAYQPRPVAIPDTRQWRAAPLTNRWIARAMLFGTIKVLEATDRYPETPRTQWGTTLTTGYRVSRLHAFSGGVEYINDNAVREYIRRENQPDNFRQLALLAGYELWPGRYTFSIHMAYNALRPGPNYADKIYQRYQLLYRAPAGLTAGIGLKADRQVADGFDVRLGYGF